MSALNLVDGAKGWRSRFHQGAATDDGDERPVVTAEASAQESGSTDDRLEGAEDDEGAKELPLDEVCES